MVGIIKLEIQRADDLPWLANSMCFFLFIVLFNHPFF